MFGHGNSSLAGQKKRCLCKERLHSPCRRLTRGFTGRR
ncbi:hypothetical protein PG5_44100 [Pseudomonas sp. G5(2012)]|nr:hypothetical protein PG5_44100 [Pseudomonas sp. G5(2012)]